MPLLDGGLDTDFDAEAVGVLGVGVPVPLLEQPATSADTHSTASGIAVRIRAL